MFIVGLQSRLVGALVYKLEGKAHTHTQVGVGGGIIIFMMMVLLRQEGLGCLFTGALKNIMSKNYKMLCMC